MTKYLGVCTIALGMAAAAAAAPTITDLAPENSIFVAGVDDFPEMMKRFKRTRLWALWSSEQVQEIVAEPLADLHEELDDVLADLDLERDDLAAPQGPVGVAFFPRQPRDVNASPGVLIVADFGLKAPQVNRVIEALIERAEEEEDVPVRHHELLGRTVYTLDVSDLDASDMLDLHEGGMPGQVPAPDAGDMLGGFERIHVVRDGRRFMLSTHFGVLRNALETVDEGGRTAFAGREDFQGAVTQIGTNDGYAVFLVRDLLALMPEGDPMGMMMHAMVQQLIGDVRGLSFGVRFDTADAMVEETFGVYMPAGKAGLTALFDVETPHGNLPPFVGPDAIAYSRMNFRFDGVMAFLRQLAETNPMLGAEINQLLLEHGDKLRQVLTALGPEVHAVARVARPVALDSLKQLYAIKSTDPGQVEQVIAELAPQMGLEPRDFVGHRIYTSAFNPMMMAGMMPAVEGFSIGFGGGHVMLGNTSMVEDALRATGQADIPSLEDVAAYRRALRAVTAPRAVAWGVVDVVSYVEYFKDFNRLMQAQVIEQMKQWDPEYARQMEAELAEEPQGPWAEFDLNLLREYLGPVAWQVRSRQDGFVGTYRALPPQQPEMRTLTGE